MGQFLFIIITLSNIIMKTMNLNNKVVDYILNIAPK